MAAKAGIIKEIYEDGTCKVEQTGGNDVQTFFGQLVVMGGGLGIAFEPIDNRRVTVSGHAIEVPEAPEEAQVKIEADPSPSRRVRVGSPKR